MKRAARVTLAAVGLLTTVVGISIARTSADRRLDIAWDAATRLRPVCTWCADRAEEKLSAVQDQVTPDAQLAPELELLGGRKVKDLLK